MENKTTIIVPIATDMSAAILLSESSATLFIFNIMRGIR